MTRTAAPIESFMNVRLARPSAESNPRHGPPRTMARRKTSNPIPPDPPPVAAEPGPEPDPAADPDEISEPSRPADLDTAPAEPPADEPTGTAQVEELTPDASANPANAPDEPLLGAGDLDEESAEIVDSQLGALLRTPLGLRGAMEAILFAAPEPVGLRRMCNILGINDSRLVSAALQQLQADYDADRRGVQIVESAQGYQMATREMFGELILRLRGKKRRPPLSPAALETLSIIAYRQPIIRAEIEAIRGVESSGTIRNLIDMGLVEMVGRKDVLGRPPMYGTTETFLAAFGLKALEELPSIPELRARIDEQVRAEEDTARPPAPAVPAAPEPSPADDEAREPAADGSATPVADEEHADSSTPGAPERAEDDPEEGWDEGAGATDGEDGSEEDEDGDGEDEVDDPDDLEDEDEDEDEVDDELDDEDDEADADEDARR